MNYANYIIIADMSDYQIHTFFANDDRELECILKTCVYDWCHNPNMKWENGKAPKPKRLFAECMADKDFGEIATVIEYDRATNTYFEWENNDDF